MQVTNDRAARAGFATLAIAAIALTACGSSSNSSTGAGGVNAAAAQSAADVGGLDKLVAAAQAEGTLNVIALPPDWANYGAIIDGFKKKYNVNVNSANPNGSSQDEVNAVNQLSGTDREPDVLDMGMAVTLANTSLYAPYKVSTFANIPAGLKDPNGLWVNDYGGYMAIGYDSSKVPAITSVSDLLKPEFKGKVALNGDPTKANAALMGVMMTSLATGGSPNDISAGVDFFKQLKVAGNFLPVSATPATIASGQTPVVVDWDYLSAPNVQKVPTWKVFVPSNGVLGGYYAQAITKNAPHPAAARLWEEYLYSPEGQNLWLKGGARPVLQDVMTQAGTIDATAAAALPKVGGSPVFLTPDENRKASDFVAANWAQAIS